MDRWRHKVAIVTGASYGIGRAVAETLAKEDIVVVGLARSKDKLDELSKKLNKIYFHPYVVDVTKEEDLLKCFDWVVTNLGPIHILVNSAGVLNYSSTTTGETSQWKELLETNVIGLSIATREAVKNMTENNVHGHVIHISGISGHKVIGGTDMYTATKYALTALTEGLRLELVKQKSGIKVTSICPGLVKTNFINAAISKIPGRNPDLEHFTTKLPHLESEDIANSVLYTLGTPPHVQVHEIIIKPVGELF